MFFGGGAVADESEVRGDPSEIERGECAEKVSAVDGAEAEGKDEVVDDAGPEVVGHAEGVGRHDGELLKAQERVGREDQGPDFVEVGVGEAEGVEHGGDVGTFGDGGGLGDGLGGLSAAGTLPEGGLGVDVGEEGTGDVGEDGVEIGGGWLRQDAGADADFGDGEVSGGGFAEGPEEAVVLSGGGESLRDGREALCHTEGEADVDGEREARARAEESAGDGVEDGGVREAFAGTEIIVGQGEIGFECGPGESANGFGVERLGFGAEEDAGCGIVFASEFVGVEIVGGGEYPGGGRDCSQGVGEKAERATRGAMWRGVGCGDENGLVGEGEGEVAECGVEGLLGEGDEADEDAAGGGCRRGGEVDIGLRGGHRAIWTFSVSVSCG